MGITVYTKYILHSGKYSILNLITSEVHKYQMSGHRNGT